MSREVPKDNLGPNQTKVQLPDGSWVLETRSHFEPNVVRRVPYIPPTTETVEASDEVETDSWDVETAADVRGKHPKRKGR